MPELEFHPYVLAQLEPLLALQEKHSIVTESYGPLTPILRHPTGGPLRPVLERIGQRLGIDSATILLLWTVQKNVVAVSTSGNPDNIRKIAEVNTLPDLSAEDMAAIDEAGKKVHFRHYVSHMVIQAYGQKEHMTEDFPLPELPEDVDETIADKEVDPLSSLTALANALDGYDDDVSAFLNTILAPHMPPATGSGHDPNPPDLAPIDKQLGDLLTRLSLLSQDTSAALEQSMHDISRTVPRLTYDLQFMRESAVSLQSSLRLVQNRVALQASGGVETSDESDDSEEARTHRALEQLAHLDKLKSRMESARDILAEAESWSSLEGEITSFIEDRQWTKAGERLAEANKSLRVFQSAEGEYESKRSLLVSLQNELETALSAALKEAIAEVDTQACASFHDVFRLMDRDHEFQHYYFAARRAPILQEWSKAALWDVGEGHEEDGEDKLSFADFLPHFFSTVLTTLSGERAQMPHIFPTESAAAVLSSFLQAALDDLSPSFHDRLAAAAEHYGSEALPEVIRALNSTEDFGVQVQSALDKLTINTQDGHLSGGANSSPIAASLHSGSGHAASPSISVNRATRAPSSAHANRMSISHRFSRSFGAAETPSSPSGWETLLYEPFLDLQTTYPTMEKRYLRYQLRHNPALTAPVRKDDPSRTLQERAAAVFAMGEEAIHRCVTFTHGYGMPGLIDALNELVQNFLADNSGFLESARSLTSKSAPDELDFEGLDYSTEDWGAFQLGLHVLQACRGMRDSLSAFEVKLHNAIDGVIPTLHVSAAEAVRLDTTLGAITLLQQSPLNSAELHKLTTTLPPTTYPLTRASDAISSFTRTSQIFLQGIILSPLKANVESYPSLISSIADKAPRRGELQLPSFSLSPTDTIARVSEGLLNLLRVFEVYAADDALAFSIETLPFVDAQSLKELVEPETDTLSSEKQQTSLSAEAVLSTWVSSLALSLLSHFTRHTLPSIRTLSSAGSAQLASDLAYVSNAVRALDVEWDDLEKWREAAECKDEAEFRAKAGDELKKGVWGIVGSLRGW